MVIYLCVLEFRLFFQCLFIAKSIFRESQALACVEDLYTLIWKIIRQSIYTFIFLIISGRAIDYEKDYNRYQPHHFCNIRWYRMQYGN